jgi:DNA repair protein RadC
MGPVAVARLKASLELGRRLMIARPNEMAHITSPADAANLLMLELGHLEQERLVTLILNTKNQVIEYHTVYKGNVNTSIIRIAEIFRQPIRRNATAIIMAHNHPSGDPTPSPEDVMVTRQIVQAGTQLDIEVLDHLLIGQGTYISMKERGLGFD